MTNRHDQAKLAPAPDDLDGLLDDAWRHLVRATETAKHGFHLPALATHRCKGDAEPPDVRTVVLRHADPDAGTVAAHTDTRSPKADQIRRSGQAAWLFYDGPQRIQVRLSGPTALLTDGPLVEARWTGSTLSARRCYLAPHAPGTPTDAPSPNLPEAVRDRVPEAEETTPGRANFAVIQTTVARLDVLYLHHSGHRRAAFTFDVQSGPPRVSPISASWVEV